VNEGLHEELIRSLELNLMMSNDSWKVIEQRRERHYQDVRNVERRENKLFLEILLIVGVNKWNWLAG
jgi:hypothetical protein